MNTSETVCLVVGSLLLLVSGYAWWRFVRVTLQEPPPACPPRSASGPTPLEFKPAFVSMILSQVCLGVNQFLQFGALRTGSEWMFELGLFVTIVCPLLALRALEQLTRRNFGSGVVAFVVAIVGVVFFFKDTDFVNVGFLVRSDDNHLWGATWIVLFFYWNACLYEAQRTAYSKRDSRLLIFSGWALLNTSFVLAMAYALLAGLHAELGIQTWLGNLIGVGEHGFDYDVFSDTQSLWSAFAGVQVLLFPFLLRALCKGYTDNLPPQPRVRSVFFRVMLVVISLLLTAALYGSFPFLREVAELSVTH